MPRSARRRETGTPTSRRNLLILRQVARYPAPIRLRIRPKSPRHRRAAPPPFPELAGLTGFFCGRPGRADRSEASASAALMLQSALPDLRQEQRRWRLLDSLSRDAGRRGGKAGPSRSLGMTRRVVRSREANPPATAARRRPLFQRGLGANDRNPRAIHAARRRALRSPSRTAAAPSVAAGSGRSTWRCCAAAGGRVR
jgi:hypothetical protein